MLHKIAGSLYTLALAVWIGGGIHFTFFVTRAIFASYGRDQAGDVVGTLMPGYFTLGLVLSAAALVLFFLSGGKKRGLLAVVALALLLFCAGITAWHRFSVYPRAEAAKARVTSFETEPVSSPARSEFRRLHGISMGLNVVVLAAGVILILIGPRPGKDGKK